jgi:uncharacterized protein YjiK
MKHRLVCMLVATLAGAGIACGGETTGSGGSGPGGGGAGPGGAGGAQPEGPSVAFQNASSTVSESVGTQPVTVVLSTADPLTAEVTVQVEDQAGSATAAADYTAVVETVTFAVGAGDGDTQMVMVGILTDDEVEMDESFDLALSDATGAVLGATSSHTLTITDDTDLPEVSFEANAVTASEFGVATLTVTLTTPDGMPSTADALVTLSDLGTGDATTGADYDDVTTASTTFPSGSDDGTTATIDIVIQPDLDREPNETIDVSFTTMGATVAAMTQATVTITDDDLVAGFGRGHARSFDPGTALTNRSSLGARGNSAPEAAAFDSTTGTLYVIADGVGIAVYNSLTSVDVATGAVTVIGPTGWAEVEGLAFDPNTNTLYGIDDSTDSLITLDTTTGLGTVVGVEGALGAAAAWESLAFDPNTNTLFTVNDTSDELYVVSAVDGTTALAGSTAPATVIEGLTFDANTNTLYASNDSGGGQLYTINAANGAATLVAAYPASTQDIEGLAYDSVNNIMYGTDNGRELLHSVNVADATLTLIGAMGSNDLDSAATDPATGIMYAASSSDGMLLSIDIASGEIVGGVELSDPTVSLEGLAFDNTGTLYGCSSSNIYTINPVTGVVVDEGSALSATSGDSCRGMAYDNVAAKLYSMNILGDIDEIDVAGAFGHTEVYFNPAGPFDFEGLTEHANGFYAVRSQGQVLVDIDIVNDTVTPLGPTGGATSGSAQGILGLAHLPGTGPIGVAPRRGTIGSLNVTTGAFTTRGAVAIDIDAAAFDPANNIVFVTEFSTDRLWAIDASNGDATFIGVQNWACDNLGFNSATSTLYCAGFNQLVILSQADASAQVVGSTGNTEFVSMAYDSTNNILYAGDGASLFTIDMTTGASTLVGAFGASWLNVEGMAYDPANNVLFASDIATDEIITVDVGTGAGTLLRSTFGMSYYGMAVLEP